MRRWSGPTRRALGALVALLVLPSMAPDLFGLACPHHAGHGEAGSTYAESPVGKASEEPGPAHHPTSHNPTGEPASPTHPGTHSGTGHAPPCTCTGSCPVSGSPTVAPAPKPLGNPGVRLAVRSSSATDAGPRPTPPFVLPFANGPPRA